VRQCTKREDYEVWEKGAALVMLDPQHPDGGVTRISFKEIAGMGEKSDVIPLVIVDRINAVSMNEPEVQRDWDKQE
jgi:hypothetical protein